MKTKIILAVMTLSVASLCSAGDDSLGAAVGSTISAAVGGEMVGYDGAVVGGVISAATGVVIARDNSEHTADIARNDIGPYIEKGFRGGPTLRIPFSQ